MTFPRPSSPIATALYVNAAVLAAIVVVLLRRTPGGVEASAWGQVQPPIAGGGGVFIMPAQFHSNVWGCYLLDTDAQTLCTYEYAPGERVLKLTAARNFRYDRQLKDFATTPHPWEIQHMVELEKEDQRVRESKIPAPSPESPPPGQ